MFFKCEAEVKKASEFVRYHGTSLDAAADAVSEPFPCRLAVGHSMSRATPGIYFSSTLSGAFQYCYRGESKMAALLTLKAPWGCKIGGSDRNKVSNRPLDCSGSVHLQM